MLGNGNEPDRGAPTSLRGWLSDVYFPAILDNALGPLSIRLGPRATIDDPMFGRTTGLPGIDGLLKQLHEWLTENDAVYTRGQFTTGIDRDVTEGRLTLRVDGNTVELPVAVVAERRRSREIELRVYYATRPFSGKSATRTALLPEKSDLVVPQLVGNHLDALRKGSIDQVLACFAGDAVLIDSFGIARANAGGGLRAYYETLSAGGWGAQRGGAADDGRTCAVEISVTKVAGKEIPPQASLLVYEKGDSGLFRAARIYDDIDV